MMHILFFSFFFLVDCWLSEQLPSAKRRLRKTEFRVLLS